MKYALNLAENKRILSACVVLPKSNYDGMPLANTLPEGNVADYLYIDNEFVYEPIPVVEVQEQPSQLDIIEAQVTYTALMTDTLLEV